MNAIVEELLAGEKRQTGTADMMLQLAEWAAASYARYDRAAVDRIAKAAAEAAFALAGPLAEAAVKETGFGVAEHKKIKNEICSRGIYDAYKSEDFCSKRVIAEQKIVEVPRAAGIVFALTPSTNPVCTAFFKVLLALMTRNAIIISPHPLAKKSTAEGVLAMAKAAEQAGAPAGIIQVIAEPNLPLINHVMQSPRVNVILATGGTPMVRAAYSSGNPGDRRRPRQCAGLRRCQRRSERRRQAHHRLQELRQLHPLHQRKRGGGGREHRRQAAPGARQGRRLCREAGGSRRHPRIPVRPRLLQRRRVGQKRGRDRRQGRHQGAEFHQGDPDPDRPRRHRRGPVQGKALPGARLRARAACPCRHLDRPRPDPHVRRRPFRRDPQQQSRHHPQLRQRGEGVARGGECALRPGGGRLRHAPGAVLHHRHRLFRPLLGRREYRAQAPGELDPHRLQRRSRARRSATTHRSRPGTTSRRCRSGAMRR